MVFAIQWSYAKIDGTGQLRERKIEDLTAPWLGWGHHKFSIAIGTVKLFWFRLHVLKLLLGGGGRRVGGLLGDNGCVGV